MYAVGYYDRVAYHDFEGPSLDLAERERLSANLGQKNVLILKTHGLLTCGETVAQAFVRMFRLERACQVQLAAQSTGADLALPSKEICELSAERSDDFLVAEGDKGYSRKPNPEFDALVRLMHRKDPSYLH
jgi:ribulose-5-phosphate 4-epimerase/fuculose-1-phosphate aldolase